MAENIQRSTGRAKQYKLDRGGTIADPGPFIGKIMNNIDPTFSGRVQVYIEAFGAGDSQDSNLWQFYYSIQPRNLKKLNIFSTFSKVFHY